jgi:NUMOD3 motif
MYLAYTYFIRNKITNQFYYGSRGANIRLKRSASEDLWIYYFTSSKEISNLRTLYGNDSFDISIIMESKEYDDCYWYEQDLIRNNITNQLCLNKQYQDRENGNRKFSSDGPCTEERRLAISKSKRGEKNHFFGKTHSKEVRDAIGKMWKGKSKSSSTKSKMSAAALGHTRQIGENNSMFGKTHSEESKEKIRKAAIGRKHSEETKQKLKEIAEKRKGLQEPLS